MSADGRTMAITIGGGSPRVMTWRPGSSAPPRAVASRLGARAPRGVPRRRHGGRRRGDHARAHPHAAGLHDRRGTSVHARTEAGRGSTYYPGDVAFTDDGRLLMFVERVGGTTRRPSRPPAAGRPGNGRRHDAEGLRAVRNPTATRLASRRPSPTTAPRWSPWSATRAAPTGCRRATGGPVRLRLEPRPATSLEFVATPTGALQFWSDGAVTRYDSRGRAAQVLDVHRAPVLDAMVLPGGRAAVTLGDGGQVELWSVDPRTGDWSLGESLVGHAGAVETGGGGTRRPVTAHSRSGRAADHLGPHAGDRVRHDVPRPGRPLGVQPDRGRRSRTARRGAGTDPRTVAGTGNAGGTQWPRHTRRVCGLPRPTRRARGGPGAGRPHRRRPLRLVGRGQPGPAAPWPCPTGRE